MNERQPPAASRQPGFTLIEMLVALSMVAIVAVSLFGSLRTAYMAREHARDALDPIESVHIALDMIGRDIECAQAPTGVLAGGFFGIRNAQGSGLADSLQFFRPAPLAMDLAAGTNRVAGSQSMTAVTGIGAGVLGAGVLGIDRRATGVVEQLEITLDTVPGESRPALVRKSSGNLLSPSEVDPLVEVLCRRVTSFGVRYFDGTLWQDQWDSTTLGDVLPAAIQVVLAVEWPGRRSGPPTVYQATRTFVLACHKDATSTGASGSTGASKSSGSSTSGKRS